jgi:hypothetical protein
MRVPEHRWRLALAVLAGVLLGGVALLAALALGTANPPRASRLIFQTTNIAGWQKLEMDGNTHEAVASIPLPPPPFTLELAATNAGSHNSAWGVWLVTGEGTWRVLLNRNGYASITHDAFPDWFEFIHISPHNNRLYIHAETDGATTARINSESVWQGKFIPGTQWGVLFYRKPALDWQYVTLHANE